MEALSLSEDHSASSLLSLKSNGSDNVGGWKGNWHNWIEKVCFKQLSGNLH
jgi:hypothetical protein